MWESIKDWFRYKPTYRVYLTNVSKLQSILILRKLDEYKQKHKFFKLEIIVNADDIEQFSSNFKEVIKQKEVIVKPIR